MSTEQVRIEDREGVRTVLIDRPAKKNALTSDMYATIVRRLPRQTPTICRVGAVLLSGSGGVLRRATISRIFLMRRPARRTLRYAGSWTA